MLNKMRQVFQPPFRIFGKRFAKYLAILLVSVMMTAPLLITSYSLARHRILAASENQLKSGLRSLETHINNITEMVDILLLQDEFIRLLLLRGPARNKDYLDARKVRSLLASLGTTQEYINYAYITFRYNDLFISSNWFFDKSTDAYPAMFEYSGLKINEWRDALYLEPSDIKFMPNMAYRVGDNTGNSGITCSANATFHSGIDRSSVLSVIFNTDLLLRDMMTDESVEHGFLYLYDTQESEYLAYQTPENLSSLLQDANNGEPKQFGDYILVSSHSEMLGLSAIVGIPSTLYRNDLHQLIWWAVVYFCIGLAVIALISFIFSAKEASNMKKLLIAASGAHQRGERLGNEYAYIGKIIEAVLGENKNKQEMIQEMRASVKARLLSLLLTQGMYKEDEAKQTRQYFGSFLDCYNVVKVSYSNENEAISSAMLGESVRHSILAFLHEHVSYPFECASLVPGEEILIMSYGQGEPPAADWLGQLVTRLVDSLQEKMGNAILFNVGISLTSAEARHVRIAYLQAQYACAANTGGAYSFVHMFVKDDAPDKKPLFDIAMLDRLKENIVIGHSDSVRKVFGILSEQMLRVAVDETGAMQLYFSVRQAVYNAWIALEGNDHTSCGMQFPEYAPHIEYNVLLAQLLQLSLFMCDSVNNRKKSKNEQLKTAILDFLRDNYNDANLCAATIADQLKISEKYVYAFVKEQTSQPLSALIEKVRLAKAEQLLRETDYPGRTIAKMVGFGSEKTFYRVFAKAHDVSPNVWRTNSGQE